MNIRSSFPAKNGFVIFGPAGLDINRYGIVKGNDYIAAAIAFQE